VGADPKLDVDPNGSVFGKDKESVGDTLEDGLDV